MENPGYLDYSFLQKSTTHRPGRYSFHLFDPIYIKTERLMAFSPVIKFRLKEDREVKPWGISRLLRIEPARKVAGITLDSNQTVKQWNYSMNTDEHLFFKLPAIRTENLAALFGPMLKVLMGADKNDEAKFRERLFYIEATDYKFEQPPNHELRTVESLF